MGKTFIISRVITLPLVAKWRKEKVGATIKIWNKYINFFLHLYIVNQPSLLFPILGLCDDDLHFTFKKFCTSIAIKISLANKKKSEQVWNGSSNHPTEANKKNHFLKLRL